MINEILLEENLSLCTFNLVIEAPVWAGYTSFLCDTYSTYKSPPSFVRTATDRLIFPGERRGIKLIYFKI